MGRVRRVGRAGRKGSDRETSPGILSVGTAVIVLRSAPLCLSDADTGQETYQPNVSLPCHSCPHCHSAPRSGSQPRPPCSPGLCPQTFHRRGRRLLSEAVTMPPRFQESGSQTPAHKLALEPVLRSNPAPSVSAGGLRQVFEPL